MFLLIKLNSLFAGLLLSLIGWKTEIVRYLLFNLGRKTMKKLFLSTTFLVSRPLSDEVERYGSEEGLCWSEVV